MPNPDYASLIEAETRGFIRKTDACYPPDAVGLTIARQREVYDLMCRAFFQGYPPGVTAQDGVLAAVPVRRYRNRGTTAGTLVYFHGGGFVVGGLHSHDDVCAEICARTGLAVVSVDHRLVPEHLHPAAYDDALAVTQAVLAEAAGPVMVA